jgi:hypothetical protein
MRRTPVRPILQGPSGHQSIAPGVYFRCLLIGCFEGIESERGIASRVAATQPRGASFVTRRMAQRAGHAATPRSLTLDRFPWFSNERTQMRCLVGVSPEILGPTTGC